MPHANPRGLGCSESPPSRQITPPYKDLCPQRRTRAAIWRAPLQVFVDGEAVKHGVGMEPGVKEWVVVSQGRTARRSDRIARRARPSGRGPRARRCTRKTSRYLPYILAVCNRGLRLWGIAPHENHERACLDGPDPVQGLAGLGAVRASGIKDFSQMCERVWPCLSHVFGRQSASVKRPCEAGVL